MGGSSQDSKKKYWYEDSIPIENRFYGVFEGGGAKGVAYNGALRAMKENKSWFCSVAGASAGAITAALIASGLSPEKIEEKTDKILEEVQTGSFFGLLRLRYKGGYFPTDGLLKRLKDVIKNQVLNKNDAEDEDVTGILDRLLKWFKVLIKKIVSKKTAEDNDVTFRQLYDATGIELNVIAADLSLRRQMILNHKLTPECVVADAVVSSCSIPFAFPSRLLQVAEGKEIVNGEEKKIFSHHTIVDGGVWSNFPMFIYEDKAFRKFYGLNPEEIDSRHILGFLLKEADEETPLKDKDVEFVENNRKMEINAKEWLDKKKKNGLKPPSLWTRIFAWLLLPFFVFGKILEFKIGLWEKGRWTPPKSRLLKYLIEGINGFLGGIYFPLFGLIACVITAFGAWEVISYFEFDQLDQLIKELKASTDILSAVWLVVKPLIVYLLAIMALFVTVFGVFTNFFLLRASRRVLYGLITTYVAGPGAPEWVEEKENIIELPIPPTIKTLSFEEVKKDGPMRKPLIDSAIEVTIKKLKKLLPKSGK